MPETKGPVTTRRRLRSELTRWRDQRGLSQSYVVDRLDWSSSKLIRIENGTVGVSVTDVRALLAVYQAPNDVVDELVDLARIAKKRSWWSSYRDTLSPQYSEFIGFEAEAIRLRQYHPALIPGLLQTEAYIRAVVGALTLPPEPDSPNEKFAQVRLQRQRDILADDRPEDFRFTAIIDEGALRRPIGGVETMREQLRHLANMQEKPHVSIAVLPFSAGAHPGLLGAFHIMDFADEADESVVYLENLRQGDVKQSPDDVAIYSDLFAELLRGSLQGDDAVKKLLRLADHIEDVD